MFQMYYFFNFMSILSISMIYFDEPYQNKILNVVESNFRGDKIIL